MVMLKFRPKIYKLRMGDFEIARHILQIMQTARKIIINLSLVG